MQIKATKEVRNYQEVVAVGMNLRQLICSVLAGAAGIGCWLKFSGTLGTEITSWLCILVALPFGLFGFVKWHGMPMEKIIPVLYRNYKCHNQVLYFRPENEKKKLAIRYYQNEKEKENKDAKNRKSSKTKAS